MKKIIVLFCLTLFIISCSSSNKKENIIEESSQIISDYADTLEGSVQNAKEVKNLMENNQNKLLQDLNSIR